MKQKKPLTEEEKKARELDKSTARHCKSVVFPLEKNNHRFLYVFRSTEGWYKMGGHSALFFKYRVAPRLKIKCNLQTDRDFYYNFKDGIVSVRDPAKLEKLLKTLRIFKKGVEPEYITFELLGDISDEQIEEMRKTEKKQKEEINKIINPGDLLPKTLNMARVVQKDIFETCRKVDKPSRELIGRDTVYVAMRIMESVLRVCRGENQLDGLMPSVKSDPGSGNPSFFVHE